MIDVLKEAFLKMYRPPLPMYVVNYPYCSEQRSKEQPGTAASLLRL